VRTRRRRNRPETVTKPIRAELSKSLFDQTPEQETAMKKSALIEVGSKEEVALLLALFGTHGIPVRKPKQKSAQ
jgi:hypothetical protein